MKKLFLWYSGTDTTAESIRNFFNIAETDTIKVEYIDGLGTDGNLSATKTLQGREPQSKTTYFQSFIDYFYKKKTSAFGAKEEDQLAQILHVFKIIDKINPDDKEVELIIGGHSRGAAVGILGFIASLYETSKTYALKGSPIKKITFIAVDPVPGSSSVINLKNDLLAFETIEGENKIKTALDFIATKSENPNLFKVIYYPARFDARNEFKADDYWLKFYETQVTNSKIKDQKSKIGQPIIETEFFIGGFRHSAMVDENEEIRELYNKNNRPTYLLKEIVNRLLGISNTDLTAIQNGIITTENDALALIASNIKILKLIERTSKDAYPLPLNVQKIAFTGSSLEEIVRNFIKNKSVKTEEKINRRYLNL